MGSKKEIFKALIREFRCADVPRIIPREREVPNLCLENPASGAPAVPTVVMIMGPRRSGKTYRLFQIMDRLCRRPGAPLSPARLLYINFEDDRLLPLAGDDLDALLEAFYELDPENVEADIALFLDEVHHAEGWDGFVRRLVEDPRIRVFLTGPAARVRGTVLTQPPGRTCALELQPLSFREYLAFKGVLPADEGDLSALRYKVRFLLEEYLVYGGFPEVVLADLEAKLKTLRNLFDLVVYKDMVEAFGIRNVPLLKELIKHLFARVGSAVSLNAFHQGLLQSVHVSRDTVLEYVADLERMDIVRLVPLFSASDKARTVNPRRVFTLDNGLRNAVSFLLAEDADRLARNLVFQALHRSGLEVFYWKEGGAAVDFVAREGGRLRGVTVAYGREPEPSAVGALLALGRAAGKRGADLAVITKDSEKSGNGINFIPLWKWLLERP